MKHSKTPTNRREYLLAILTELQFDIPSFLKQLELGSSYETLVDQWVRTYYEEEFPVEQAVVDLYARRLQWLELCTTHYPTVADKLEAYQKRILLRLRYHPLYFQASEAVCKTAQQQVRALVKTQLYTPQQVEQKVIQWLRSVHNDTNDNTPSAPPDVPPVTFSTIARAMARQFRLLANCIA